MNERLENLRARIDALEPKERFLVLAAAILVIGFAWHSVLIQPLEIERRRLQADAARLQAQTADLDLQAVAIVEASQRDPNEPLRRQLASAEQQTVEFEGRIRELAGQLLEPRDMAGVLRSVLESTRGMQFVSLQGLGAQPLLPPDAQTGARNGARTAYRHGFRIRFRGSYLDTVGYLRALEALPWRFFWDAVELDVTNHPNAEGSVVVYTLSLNQNWIGV